MVPTGAPQAQLMPVAGLSAQSGAPILFATSAGVPSATAAVLERLGHPAIYVIGDGQLHHATMQELRHFGHVTAINGTTQPGGEDRSPTGNSIQIARFTDGTFGWGVKEPGHGLVFANAARPLDGPGGGAAVRDQPVRAAAGARKRGPASARRWGPTSPTSSPPTPRVPAFRPSTAFTITAG